MNSRSKYRTKQREILLQYFESVSGRHITVWDVCEYFRKRGEAIAQATIYRQIESFVNEGILNKYTVDNGSPACFEYVGEQSHVDSNICIHCKCEKCGKLTHLRGDEFEQMFYRIYGEELFRLDPIRTVLYGLCKECAGGTEENV